MPNVGQIEKVTQQRVVRLFRERLGYYYLGDRTDREDNRNVEEDQLRQFLREKQGYDAALITRALHLFVIHDHCSISAKFSAVWFLWHTSTLI